MSGRRNFYLGLTIMITMIESYPNIPPIASRAKLLPIVDASNDPSDGGKFELNTFIEI